MASQLFQGFCKTQKLENDFEREKKFLECFFRPRDCYKRHNTNLSDDQLDFIRQNAHADFVKNGIEVEMDDLDIRQYRMRQIAARSPPLSAPFNTCLTGYPGEVGSSSPSDSSSVLDGYLERRKQKKKPAKAWCVFCKNNGELPDWFRSHTVKDSMGRTACPILRRYVCPKCGKSGDDAHTVRYCTVNGGRMEPAITELLRTTRMSSGRLRTSIVPRNSQSN